MPEEGIKKNHLNFDSKDNLLRPPLKDNDAAKYLGVGVQTLRNWRHLSKGPPYLKLSPGPRGRIGYLVEDLQAYRRQRRIDPEVK